MSILLYIEGYHEQTFGDGQYLVALDRLSWTEYQDSSRALIFHNGGEQVWLIKLPPRKTLMQKIWSRIP